MILRPRRARRPAARLGGRLAGRLISRPAGRLVGRLAGHLASRSADRLADRLAGRSAGHLAGRSQLSLLPLCSQLSLLVALLGACSSGHELPPTSAGPRSARLPARPISTEAPSGEPRSVPDRAHDTGARVIPAAARQLITGVIADWDATTVTLRQWRRHGGAWIADGSAWQGTIGQAGAAWGKGLHGDDAPGGHAGPSKHEGDGKSPAGAFELRGVYGYAAAPPAGGVLPYTQVTADWRCVDDPASHHYTQILDRSSLAADWTSAELMRRSDELYTWVIDIAHNRAAAPGAGSCIFFHVWRGPASPTAGCTAMPEPRLAQLIGELDATAVYVLLPRAEYDALAMPWGLPLGEK